MVYIYNLIPAPTTFQIIFKIMAAVFVYCTHTTRILPYWRKKYFGRSIWKRKSNSVKQWSSRGRRKTGNVLVCCAETKVTLLNSEQWWLFKFKDVPNFHLNCFSWFYPTNSKKTLPLNFVCLQRYSLQHFYIATQACAVLCQVPDCKLPTLVHTLAHTQTPLQWRPVPKQYIWVILRCWGNSSILCQQNSDAL